MIHYSRRIMIGLWTYEPLFTLTRFRALFRAMHPSCLKLVLRFHYAMDASIQSSVSRWVFKLRLHREAALPSASAYAAPFDGIQARQRWPRYAFAGALSRASQFAINGTRHRAGAGSVFEVLAGLKAKPGWQRFSTNEEARAALATPASLSALNETG